MLHPIVKPCHLQRTAYVYLRQSSPGQVRRNREGQQRQQAMVDHVATLGWPRAQIVLLDGDTGRSGSSQHGRTDFQELLEAIVTGKAGLERQVGSAEIVRYYLDEGKNRLQEEALDRAGLVFHRIGNEGGLLPGAPIVQDSMLLAPAERADVILDFSGFHPGEEITLLNIGPDEPFKGLQAPEPQMPAAATLTRTPSPAGSGTCVRHAL